MKKRIITIALLVTLLVGSFSTMAFAFSPELKGKEPHGSYLVYSSADSLSDGVPTATFRDSDIIVGGKLESAFEFFYNNIYTKLLPERIRKVINFTILGLYERIVPIIQSINRFFGI